VAADNLRSYRMIVIPRLGRRLSSATQYAAHNVQPNRREAEGLLNDTPQERV
jgi:hypothetical protein